DLDGVRVDADALLGGAAEGGRYVEEARRTGRLGVAAQAIGIAQAALENALAYAGQREQFGRKLREFEGIQFKLADMALRVEAARALLERAARDASARTSALAKVCASEAAGW